MSGNTMDQEGALKATDIRCELCADEGAISQIEIITHGESEYVLYECQVCQAQFWTPFKNPGAAWYERDERYADRNADPILKPNEKHIGVMNALKGKTGRVLDIGCGVGNFLALAKARGWECWGIDFDKDAIEAGKRTFGLPRLQVATLEEFISKNPELRFDLITFFDVFEHLDNHNEFLERVRSILTPDGRIALSVPYRHGLRWLMPHDLPPRHLTRWEEISLDNTLERHKFVVEFSKRLPATLYYVALKFRFRYGKWASFGVVGKMKRMEKVGAGASRAATASARVSFIHFAAKAKDIALFGMPALLLWLLLLPSRKRYTDFYVIARPN